MITGKDCESAKNGTIRVIIKKCIWGREHGEFEGCYCR